MLSLLFYLAAVLFFCLAAAGIAIGVSELYVGLACFAFAHVAPHVEHAEHDTPVTR
jgi:hypothetical protein